MLTFNGSFAIYITGKPEVREHWRQIFMYNLARRYGGASYHEGTGAWVADNGQVLMEPHDRVVCFCENGIDPLNWIMGLVSCYQQHAEQEAVMLEINGEAFILFTEEDYNELSVTKLAKESIPWTF